MKEKGLTEIRILGIATYVQIFGRRTAQILSGIHPVSQLFGVGKKFEEKLPITEETE